MAAGLMPPEDDAPPDAALLPDADFAASADERLVDARPRLGLSARGRFAALVLLALLVHAAILAAFLWRDAHDPVQVATTEETPVEVIVEKPPEKPPEPPKPPPPPPPPEAKKPPPPPPPPEDLSPSYSAPREENQETLKTEKLQPKTSVPKAPQPPSEGTPTPKPQAAPPEKAAPSEAKEEESAKEEDKTKPDAEALDKAKPKVAKQAKTKAAKAAPRTNKKTADLFASLSGSSALPEMTFARPTPKTKVYGGTEDVRWMSTVEGMLEAKVGQLPHTAHWQAGGHVAICFHVNEGGRVMMQDYCQRSGYPDIDQIAMRALMLAGPFPPPPRGVEHGLVWVSTFDGQLPKARISKR